MIEIGKDGEIFTLTLNRPPLNILNIAMLDEMGSALKEALRPSYRFLVLKAVGKVFSAGADVADHLPENVGRMMASFHEVFRLLSSFEGLTVSCVHGPALGGGCEVALFSDLVLASSEAKFGQPEIKLGVFPPVAMAFLPRISPPRAALELILSGDTIDANEALRLGLVNKVFEAGRFDERVGEYLDRFKALSLSSLKIAKETLRKMHPSEFEAALGKAEDAYMNQLMRTPDAKEGLVAFLEKRKPVWRAPQAVKS